MAKDFFEGGSADGTHAASPQPEFRVAPTSDGRLNRIRLRFVPIACFRVNHALFGFDSSVPMPGLAAELPKLRAIVESNPDAPASIFGHADPVGSDAYNKLLSGRRARAFFALLTRDVSIWERLFSSPQGGDHWGLRSTQVMLGKLLRASDSTPYYAGRVDGRYGPESDEAIRAFQADEGLAVDGVAGPVTRKRLYARYMDAICVSPDAPFVMKASDFLGGGGDADGKAAYQGCSDFNPVLLLASGEADSDSADRNEANAPNRRVMVFFFRPGTTASSAEWPCPRWSEGADACRAQFWPDGDERRKPAAQEREYRIDRHTMACRFYDRFARVSPCEGIVPGPRQDFRWLTDHSIDEGLALVVRSGGSDGEELRRFPMPTMCTGPGDCATFDLSDLPRARQYSIELYRAEAPQLPLARVNPSRLRAGLDAEDIDAILQAFSRPLRAPLELPGPPDPPPFDGPPDAVPAPLEGDF